MRITALTYRPTVSAAPRAATYSLFPIPYSLNYAFSAKERDTETGLSYFGARYYSSDLSIWLSVDPMAAKYPSLSPYTYCADNPVRLVDPNGEEIVGTDNKAVSYSYDNQGNVVWSSNASDDTKRIGNAMLQTDMGKIQFDKLIKSKLRYELIISNESKKGDDGGAVFGSFAEKAILDDKGNKKTTGGIITIYEGSCKQYKDRIGGSFGSLAFWASTEEFIASVAGHEAEHATSPNNLKLDNGPEKEAIPLSIQFEILLETFYKNAKDIK